LPAFEHSVNDLKFHVLMTEINCRSHPTYDEKYMELKWNILITQGE